MITYNSFITACAKGVRAEHVLQLLETMQLQGLIPNVISYTALISSCGKSQQPERAFEHFEAMQTHGLTPDVATYNTIISACAKSQRVRRRRVSEKGAWQTDARGRSAWWRGRGSLY